MSESPSTYSQFPQVENCEDRLRRLEAAKDASYTDLQRRYERDKRQLSLEVEIRKQVHRDDYERSALLIAGLKMILALGGEAGDIASRTLYDTWGVGKPTAHCWHHSKFSRTCPDCQIANERLIAGD